MPWKSTVGIVLSVVLAGTTAFAGDHESLGSPSHPFGRIGPVGGWNPDGGGLFHWWNPDCFARSCNPDDYCRKPLPRPHCTARPVVAVHAQGHARSHICPTCNKAH